MKKTSQKYNYYINDINTEAEEFMKTLSSFNHGNEFMTNNHIELMKEGHCICFTVQNKILRMTKCP